MRSKQKLILYLITAFVLSMLFSLSYILFSESLAPFDNGLRDKFFKFRGEIKESGSIVIVDIDEKSLSQIGHWPWSRDVVAKLVDTLNQAEAGLIAFDIIFAEEDNTSPHFVLKKVGISLQNMQNYDKDLAKSLYSAPTILAYQFAFNKSEYAKKKFPLNNAVFVTRGDSADDFIRKAYGTIINIPILQESTYSNGFVNFVSSASSVVRYIPMVASYNNMIYPSLSLEVARIVFDARRVFIDSSAMGITGIHLGDINIPTNFSGDTFINYRGASKTFKYISAVDILNGNFKKEDVDGKIILIGTSAFGLSDLKTTPFDTAMPGVEIHATMIENILDGDFISNPAYAVAINVLHIFAVIFISLLGMAYVSSLIAALLLVTFLFVDFYFLFYMLFEKGFILNILFPMSAIVVASIIAILINYLFVSKNEKRVKRQVQQIESILSSILMPILIISKRSRKILYSNKYASAQYGLTIDPKDNILIDDIYKNSEQEQKIDAILKEKGVVDNIEEKFITSVGKKFTALLSVVPLKFGSEDANIMMVTDITKQKNIEDEIRNMHNSVQQSIKFASLIQSAILPDNAILKKFCVDYFTIWQPRDIVGGDIFLIEEISEDELIIMVIDGAGHGVPGAFLTMLVKAISSQIIAGIQNRELSSEPNMILEYFNKGIKTMLKQEKGSTSNTGFDGGILYYNRRTNECSYAGAKTDLYLIQNNTLQIIKGDRKNVGFARTKYEQKYSLKSIEITEDLRLYMTTDGIIDQEGENESRFGDELFEKIIVENHMNSFKEQKDVIHNILHDFKKDFEQSDDITVVGIELKKV